MIKLKKGIKLLLLFLAFTLTVFYAGPIFAKEYVVEGYIFIPTNFRDQNGISDQPSIAKYKYGIADYLKRSRDEFFAVKLNGKNFNIDQNIKVVYGDLPIAEDQDLVTQFTNIGGFDKIEAEDGKIKVVWVLGASHASGILGVEFDTADSAAPEYALIALRFDDLIATYEDRNSVAQKIALSLLTHELGHAFGLVRSGYADNHPCTTESPGECTKDAPKPYASALEWRSVMGYEAPIWDFPNLFLNNSNYNPELWRLYQSPFVNPQGDPGPVPAPSDTSNKPVIFNISPNTINAGQNFFINGTYLEKFNNVELRKQGTGEVLGGVSISNNSGNIISVRVDENAVAPNSISAWQIKISDDKGNTLSPERSLTIKGKSKDIILSAKVSTTCGVNSSPLSSVPIYLETFDKKIIATTLTDNEGEANIAYTISEPVSGDKYIWEPGVINNQNPPNAKTIEVPNPPVWVDENLNFHYKDCPSGGQAPESFTGQPGPSESVLPTETKKITKARALVHGFEDGWFMLPQGWRKISVGGRIFENNIDSCLIANMDLKLEKVKDGVGNNIFPVALDTSFTTVKQNNIDGEITNGAYVNCQSYWAFLDQNSSLSGTYLLKIAYSGDTEFNNSEDEITFTIDSNNKVVLENGGPFRQIIFPQGGTIDDSGQEPIPTGQPTPSPSVSGCREGEVSRNECIGCNISQQICKYSNCSEYICIDSQNDNACASWCISNSPTPSATVVETKRVANLYLYGKEVDLNTNQPADIVLSGTQGSPSEIDFPGLAQYSDNTSKNFIIRFKYQPDILVETQSPNPSPAKVIKGWYCSDSSNNMYISYSDGTSEFNCKCGDNTDDCRGGEVCINEANAPDGFEFDAKCIPTPTGSVCGEQPEDFVQCGGTCPDGRVIRSNELVEVHKGVDQNCNVFFECGKNLGAVPDQCGNPAPAPCEIETNNYCFDCRKAALVETNTCTGLSTLTEDMDVSCNKGGVCENPEICQEPYTQCGGTIGLEEEPENHTFYVTPICDPYGNIFEYLKTDLGRVEDQCGN